MLVADVMTPASVTDSPDETLRESAIRMWRQQTGSVLVLNGDRLVGIVTERDIMRAVADKTDLDTTTVGDVMTTEILTVSPSTPLVQAARLMTARWVRHLPVLDAGQLSGMVSLRDLVAALASLEAGLESGLDQPRQMTGQPL